MKRPQFSLKTLLWLMVVVAAAFGGAEWQRRYGKQPTISRGGMIGGPGRLSGHQVLTMPDGTVWFRVVYDGTPQGTLMFYGGQGELISVKAPDFTPIRSGTQE